MIPLGRIIALIALALCATAAVAQQPAQRPRGAPSVAAPAKTAPATATAPLNAGLPPLDDLTATRERPLFSSTRRPPEVEPPPKVAAPITEAASMPFELVGIVLGSDVNAAIFRNTDSKEETRVAKGEKIGNWNLEEVSERAVVLHGGDKRVRMRLFNEAKSPGVKVGGTGESLEPDEAASDSEEQVDEDISPSNSPQVRPATAQPKPPPSLQNKGQRPRRPQRRLPRQRQER